MRYARHLRSSDAHDGCRDERIFATGDVTTNPFHRDDLLSELTPVAHLRLELVHRVSLAFGEVRNLLLTESEVVLESLTHGSTRRSDFIVGDAKVGSLPAIKIIRIASYGGIPILLDVVE